MQPYLRYLTSAVVLFRYAGSAPAQQLLPSQFFGTSGIVNINFGNAPDTGNDILRLPDDRFVASAHGYEAAFAFPAGKVKTARFSAACAALDTTYGVGGKSAVVFDFDNPIYSMALQPDGKIIGAGMERVSNAGSASKPMVVRLKTNGSPDSTFGTNSRWTGRFDAVSSGDFYTAHVYPNGRILAVGQSRGKANGGTNGLGMMRFKPAGTLDSTFGTAGMVRIPLTFASNTRGVLAPNGDIFVVTTVFDGTLTNLGARVYKFDSTGALQTTWGTAGFVQLPHNLVQSFTNGPHILQQADGRVVAVVPVQGSSTQQVGISRIKVNGTMDSTFGMNGDFTTALPTTLELKGASMMPDGKVVAAGHNGTDPTLLRLSLAGALDTGFAGGGVLTYVMPGQSGEYFSKAIPATDSSLMAVGFNSGSGDLMVVKFTKTPAQKWVSLGPDTTLCAGTPLTLDAGNPGAAYAWNTSATTQIISPTTTGAYRVTVTDPQGCVQSDTVQVTFNPVPPQPVISQSGNVLSATGSGTFQWFLNGAPVSGVTSSTLAITTSGSYTVSVTSGGCSSTSLAFAATLGVDDLTGKLGVQLFPNPVQNWLRVSSGGAGETTVFVMDMRGARLIEERFSGTGHNIDMRALPVGVYVVKVRTARGVGGMRIVKE